MKIIIAHTVIILLNFASVSIFFGFSSVDGKRFLELNSPQFEEPLCNLT